MKTAGTLLGLATAVIAIAAGEHEARACGGCFHNPEETPTVVTDHRMVMTIGQGESTLYDQIQYTGDPASFAWVLPYAGDITIGLSADIVFDTLDTLTQTTILPPAGCVPQTAGNGTSSGSSGTSGTGGSSSSGGVTVISHQVVGPYDTVQLAATDPNALENWLKQNNYAVPADVAPVIATYVNEHFNFLALKLVPDKGVTDMRPVRVTTKGANIVLPLRMVAAGTGATVGVTLWVLGAGRYEPQDFPYFVIDNNDLGWDINTQRSNYTDLRASLEAKTNGAGWEIESSTTLAGPVFESIVRQGSGFSDGSSSGGTGTESQAEVDYSPVKDESGNVTESAVQVREDDLALLVVATGDTRVTRMRSDLAHAALTQDLQLRASTDQSEISNTRQLTHCGIPANPSSTIIVPAGAASLPVDNTTSGAADAGTASAQTFSAGGGGCTTTASSSDKALFSTVGLAFAVIVAARKRRRAKRD